MVTENDDLQWKRETAQALGTALSKSIRSSRHEGLHGVALRAIRVNYIRMLKD